MVSLYSQSSIVKMCAECGKPTQRHPSAKYCWLCVAEKNRESAMKSAAKIKAKQEKSNAKSK